MNFSLESPIQDTHKQAPGKRSSTFCDLRVTKPACEKSPASAVLGTTLLETGSPLSPRGFQNKANLWAPHRHPQVPGVTWPPGAGAFARPWAVGCGGGLGDSNHAAASQAEGGPRGFSLRPFQFPPFLCSPPSPGVAARASCSSLPFTHAQARGGRGCGI